MIRSFKLFEPLDRRCIAKWCRPMNRTAGYISISISDPLQMNLALKWEICGWFVLSVSRLSVLHHTLRICYEIVQTFCKHLTCSAQTECSKPFFQFLLLGWHTEVRARLLNDRSQKCAPVKIESVWTAKDTETSRKK